MAGLPLANESCYTGAQKTDRRREPAISFSLRVRRRDANSTRRVEVDRCYPLCLELSKSAADTVSVREFHLHDHIFGHDLNRKIVRFGNHFHFADVPVKDYLFVIPIRSRVKAAYVKLFSSILAKR